MRYELVPIKNGAKRTLKRFAWWPRRIGWTWILWEMYIVEQRYLDPDGDGIFTWVTLAKRLIKE